MSQIVQIFDPSLKTSDTFPAAQSAAQGSLHFWNESPFGLQIVFQNGSNLYVPAWFHRHYCGQIQRGNITWNKQNTLASNIPPLSQVIIEAYDSGEDYPPDGPLTRQTNIGNASTVATAATSIQNDGNAVGTSIVEATVTGEVSSAVSWTNDAKLINGDATHPGFVQFDNNQIASDGAGHFFAQTFRLPVGGLAKNKVVVVSVSTGKNTVTHALGSIPDYVSLTLRQGSIPSVILSYDRATITTSQIDIWSSGNATVEIALTLL